MFGIKRKNNVPTIEYDPDTMKAVLKCSICNGEQVAGFKDTKTGRFTDVMLIRSNQDLDTFKKMYGLSSIVKEY